jgi:hypothetical protein
VTEEEERDDEHTESEYYYSRYAKFLTDEEQEDIFGSASIQLGNPVYVAVMQKTHVSGRNFLVGSFVPLITVSKTWTVHRTIFDTLSELCVTKL